METAPTPGAPARSTSWYSLDRRIAGNPRPVNGKVTVGSVLICFENLVLTCSALKIAPTVAAGLERYTWRLEQLLEAAL